MKICSCEKNTFACQKGIAYPSQALCRCAPWLGIPLGGGGRICPFPGEGGGLVPELHPEGAGPESGRGHRRTVDLGWGRKNSSGQGSAGVVHR